jgi:hypothetical protein
LGRRPSLSELLLAVLMYAATALSAAVFILDCRPVRRWRGVRRTRRTTENLGAHPFVPTAALRGCTR